LRSGFSRWIEQSLSDAALAAGIRISVAKANLLEGFLIYLSG
jgi:hypothetical protein